MTEEYRAFLDSRKTEESEHRDSVEHSDIPRWKPPEKKEEEGSARFSVGEFLAHHGVPGMKWGVRHDKPKSGNEPVKKKEPEFNSKTLQYKKKAQNLTDDELDRRIKRMQKEATYDQLRKTLQPKTKAEKRKELRQQIFKATMATAAAAIMTQVYKKAIVFMVDKASKGKIKLKAG